MQFTYDAVVEYMNRYFEAYTSVAQDPETVHLMNEYYAPDFEVVVYTPRPVAQGRASFLERSSCHHAAIHETLIPEHMVVDTVQHMVSVLLRAEFAFKATGEVISQKFSAYYRLALDENNSMKIKNLWLFGQYVRPGTKTIFEVYEDLYRAARG